MSLSKSISLVCLALALIVPSTALAYWTTPHTPVKVKVYGSGSFSIVLNGSTCSLTPDGSYFVSSGLGGADRLLTVAMAGYLSGRTLNLSVTDNPTESRCDVTSIQIE